MDLFAEQRAEAFARVQPLAVRMRPRTLDEFVGQEHFAGPGQLLRRMLAADRLTSAIFYGPPGCGKTTLARIIAAHTKAAFVTLHAAEAGVKDVREVIEQARAGVLAGRRTVLFLDEIHRFNRAQQDVLLKDVEEGVLTLIGATTENPFFTVNSPLISRSQVFEFRPLTAEQIETVLRRALADRERGLGGVGTGRERSAVSGQLSAGTQADSLCHTGGRVVEVDEEALRFIAMRADGDARRALTALEVAVRSVAAEKQSAISTQQSASGGKPQRHRGTEGRAVVRADEDRAEDEGTEGSVGTGGGGEVGTGEGRQVRRPDATARRVTLRVAEESLQIKAVPYDAAGDAHYDIASAFIKSMRGSDPDAALYWLARMLEGGEDPRFIARRIAICASEDVGNADPQAAVLAAAAVQITQAVGLPECQFALAQAAVYIACSPKSNAVTVAIGAARKDVREGLTVPVPEHLRDASYRGAQRLGHGQGYRYPHNDPSGWVAQDYLGVARSYYNPTDRGVERRLGEYLKALRERRSGPAGEKKS